MRECKIQFLRSGCVFLSPSEESVWLGWGDPVRTVQLPCGFALYAPDFFLKDEKPWWSFPNVDRVRRFELIEDIRQFLESQSGAESSLLNLQWTAPSFEFFKGLYENLQGEFHSGKLKKAVPVVFESARWNASEETIGFNFQRKARLLLSLLESTKNVPVTVYGVWDEEEGILGATPEILFQKEKGEFLNTVALAGTRVAEDVRGSRLPDVPLLPLLDDPKELEEHQWVIEGIRHSLASLGELRIGQTRVLELPTLSHLCTPIQLKLDPVQWGRNSAAFFERVVRQLHPTPALGAFPKAEGMLWLEKLQTQVDRNRLGAPFGILTADGECHCVVGIRNIQWKSDSARVGAGCGVIPASELNREWRELQAKIQSVKKSMGLNEPLSVGKENL